MSLHQHRDAQIHELARRAQELRIRALRMVNRAQSGHLGGSFSAAEIMAAMYFHHLRIDPAQPQWPDRDRFIVSKGHCAPVYYAALSAAGFFCDDCLDSFRQCGSVLQGHPDRNKCAGVDMNSGPLGNGLSVGVGLALAARLRGGPYRSYVLLGDGESEAGIVWEAAMSANKYRLDGLTAILDYNGVQLDGMVCDVMPLEPVTDKWRAFGWHVFEVDGHNVRQVVEALDAASGIHGRPSMIIAHTIKGKGVSFMENNPAWHGKAPSAAEFERALTELQNGLRQLDGQEERGIVQ
jgi:transketolase